MNIGSWNTKNTYDFSVQVRNFLLPLSIKVLRHKERDTHSFYSGFVIRPPSRAAPLACKFVWPQRAPKVVPSRSVSSLNSTKWLFQNLPKSSARFRCITSFALTSPSGLLWPLWVKRSLRPCTRVNTSVNVTPNYPMHWAKRFSA